MSRYYDPEIGQFISMDSVDYLEAETIGGVDLYAYCQYNPVMMIDSTGTSPKWWQAILIGVGIIIGAALVATAIAFTGGTVAAFMGMWGTAIVGGLKIAAVAGVSAGVIRAGSTAIGGGSLGDVGKSFVTGFADGFFAGSIYAGGSMILSAGAFRIAGLFNNGYGWSSGKWLGGYQTPNTPGISFGTFKGGPNGGRSFGFDLDIYHAFHFHTKIFGKGSVKTHRWMLVPFMIGIGVGFSDPWSEW